jgi:hypothetical protein
MIFTAGTEGQRGETIPNPLFAWTFLRRRVNYAPPLFLQIPEGFPTVPGFLGFIL